jgi:ParB-like chromosome segregation protein Spo0J
MSEIMYFQEENGMSYVKYFKSDLSDFRSSTPQILCGDVLKEVQAIQASIYKFGLLNPLVVAKNGPLLMVIDGRKRLAALRRLEFMGKLPRDLIKVPFIVVSQARILSKEVSEDPLPLLTNAEKYDRFVKLRAEGKDVTEIGEVLYASSDFTRKMLCVSRLSPTLQKSFFNGAISLAQAAAFSALPNPLDQDNLLKHIGPFTSPNDISRAIASNHKALRRTDTNIIKLENESVLARAEAA